MISMPFKILTVGSGLAGLSAATAGHRVTVLEATSALRTIRGSIGNPSNAMRCYDYLGLLDRLVLGAGFREGKEILVPRWFKRLCVMIPSAGVSMSIIA